MLPSKLKLQMLRPEVNSSIVHSVCVILDVEVWIVLQLVDAKSFQSQTFLRFDDANAARLNRGAILLHLHFDEMNRIFIFKQIFFFVHILLYLFGKWKEIIVFKPDQYIRVSVPSKIQFHIIIFSLKLLLEHLKQLMKF